MDVSQPNSEIPTSRKSRPQIQDCPFKRTGRCRVRAVAGDRLPPLKGLQGERCLVYRLDLGNRYEHDTFSILGN